MERYFNTAGPCNPMEHYMLPALDRTPEVRRLVAMRRYFVVHAPRQTGKTTALNALVDEINDKGEMVALYCTLETLQNARDPSRAATAIAALLRSNAERALPGIFQPATSPCPVRDGSVPYAAEVLAVSDELRDLCRRAGKPLVVFFDEADCLDLCVEYRDRRYALEVKTAKNFKGEKSYGQLAKYLSTLGLDEGWMPIFDSDPAKPWEEKLYVRDVVSGGKKIHVVGL